MKALTAANFKQEAGQPAPALRCSAGLQSDGKTKVQWEDLANL